MIDSNSTIAMHEQVALTLLGTDAVSIVVWDGHVRCRAANPLARTLFRAHDGAPDGLEPEQLLLPTAASFLRTHVQLTLDTNLASSGIAANLAEAGETPRHRLFAFVPVGDDVVPQYVLGVSLDISGQRQLGDKSIEQLETEAKLARAARDEYERAHADYIQLVRHRIANPLAVVIGGLRTLLDLDLSEDIQEQLLRSMLESAERIAQVALDPIPLSAEETGLDPTPHAPRT